MTSPSVVSVYANSLLSLPLNAETSYCAFGVIILFILKVLVTHFQSKEVQGALVGVVSMGGAGVGHSNNVKTLDFLHFIGILCGTRHFPQSVL